ncbi:MAG: SRPBCC domain-containing protein [Flavipsychrobacter sp.]|nr:SRPBCC domain-containing protein [Flavipsychrobacter sp.]
MQPDFNLPSEQQITSTRIFETTPERVFRAWSDPEQLKDWWGPKDFTNTFEIFDFRPGGTWKFVMHGPGGEGNYKNEVIFEIIDEPRLIMWNRVTQPYFRVLTTFESTEDGNTLLTFRMQFADKETCDKIRPFAPEKNEENFDRLERTLTQMANPR